MKSLLLKEINQPLNFQDVKDPEIEEGRVVVDLKAAALNHRDLWIAKGKYARIKLPVILGSDGAGMLNDRPVIINPGMNWGENPQQQSQDFHILGMPSNGTFAERVLVPKDRLHDKPPHLSWAEAAALPLGGVTAFRALFTQGQLEAGQKVLISGVGGGVAMIALQFAIAAGAVVYVTSGSKEKIGKAIELGAKDGANYREENWHKSMAKKAGNFDLIIDSAAGEGFAQLVKIVKPAGRLVIYGGTQGKINDLSPQIIFWKQLSIIGSTMGSDEDFRNMLDFVNHHEIKPVVDSVFELRAGNRALKRMDEGKQFGKIVLEID